MLVSKPCVHPGCPERSGFIRGYYESVELIREIQVETPSHKIPSSANAASEDTPPSTTSSSDDVGEESVISNPLDNDQNDKSRSSKSSEHEGHEESESTILNG